MPKSVRKQNRENEHTDTHTHRMTTVTLAVHACRGLTMILNPSLGEDTVTWNSTSATPSPVLLEASRDIQQKIN